MSEVNDFKRFVIKATVQPNGCWTWNRPYGGARYGSFYAQGKRRLAHRVAYEWFTGRSPVGKVVRHTCDQPLCVNPQHLLLGTQKENMQDASRRGRFPPRGGVNHVNAKLTSAEVYDARTAHLLGQSMTFIAERLGVSVSTISLLLGGKRYLND